MRKLDEGQDNVRRAVVQKPISSSRAVAKIGGKIYKIDNPNMGYLNAGDSVPVYRATGAAKLGRID
jgi:membrane protein implicated in regulation of membrane protease activity